MALLLGAVVFVLVLLYIPSQRERGADAINQKLDWNSDQMEVEEEVNSILDSLYGRSWSWTHRSGITLKDRELFESQILGRGRGSLGRFKTAIYPQIKFILANPHFPSDLRIEYESILRQTGTLFLEVGDLRVAALLSQLTGQRPAQFRGNKPYVGLDDYYWAFELSMLTDSFDIPPLFKGKAARQAIRGYFFYFGGPDPNDVIAQAYRALAEGSNQELLSSIQDKFKCDPATYKAMSLLERSDSRMYKIVVSQLLACPLSFLKSVPFVFFGSVDLDVLEAAVISRSMGPERDFLLSLYEAGHRYKPTQVTGR